jgi:hypothetical protein
VVALFEILFSIPFITTTSNTISKCAGRLHAGKRLAHPCTFMSRMS